MGIKKELKQIIILDTFPYRGNVLKGNSVFDKYLKNL